MNRKFIEEKAIDDPQAYQHTFKLINKIQIKDTLSERYKLKQLGIIPQEYHIGKN